MQKKIDILKGFAQNNQWEEALKLCAKFPQLGKEKEVITRAKDCLVHPRFYLSMGYNLQEHIDLGIEAIKRKYKI